jgi:hypothetical protein
MKHRVTPKRKHTCCCYRGAKRCWRTGLALGGWESAAPCTPQICEIMTPIKQWRTNFLGILYDTTQLLAVEMWETSSRVNS